MMRSGKSPFRFRIFYGWYVLAVSFVILFFTTGARFTIGVVFKPLMVEFGWDRAAVSLGFFINMTIYALSLIIAGRSYDRYGPKWVIVISSCFLSAGFMSLAFIDSLWQFSISYGFVAAIGMGGTTVPIFAALMSKWFQKGRSLAVSLGLAGSCIGQSVLVPVFASLVLRYGWRLSYFFLGVVMLVVIVALTLLVIKGDPAQLGIEPWGKQVEDISVQQKIQGFESDSSTDLGLSGAMKTRSFWLFVSVMFICGSGDFLVTTHLIPMATDYNVSPTAAARVLASLGIMSLAGILLVGPVSDLIGIKTPIALTFLIRFLLFIFIFKYHNLFSFYAFGCAFGFTFLITGLLNPILVGRLYGFSHVGLISGFTTTVHHLGGGFWAYMAGEIFDRTGNYQLVFIISTIMALLAILCTLLIQEKRHQLNE